MNIWDRRSDLTVRPWRRRGLLGGAIALVLVFALALPALAVPGDLDTSFDGDGLATTDFTTQLDFAVDLAISGTDGSLVAAGRAGGSGGRFALARFTSSGVLDATFGAGGKVLTNFTSGYDAVYAVGIQADGKVVAAGTAAGSGGRIAVARYLTDGTLDPAFGGGDGKVITNLTAGDDYAYALEIQLDQKIVVAGGAGGSGGRFMLARYLTGGTLDSSFSGDGKQFTDFTTRYDYVDALALQGDGKIVVIGSTNYYGTDPRFALARYDAAGVLDTTFSGDGKQTTRFPNVQYAYGFGIAIQSDDRIVAAGQAASSVAVARYSASGVLDGTFGGDGRVMTNFTTGLDYADEVLIQADGSIVTVGSADFYGANARFALVRYESSGALDTTFGGDGKVTTNPSAGVDWAFGAVLQPSDGKIVVAGRTAGGGGRFIAGRYLV